MLCGIKYVILPLCRYICKLAESEMQKVLMAHIETNMMNLSYNGTINNQWETLCEKVYTQYMLTLWGI